MREVVCENCELSLHDILANGRRAPEPTRVTAQLRVYSKRTALSFDRAPPLDIRTALKGTGWRWDPQLRVWWSGELLQAG